MQDTTVSATRDASGSGANTRPSFFRPVAWPGDEDVLLARVLTTSWSLATGRRLRVGVPPELLTEDELISFWADDLIATARTSGTG